MRSYIYFQLFFLLPFWGAAQVHDWCLTASGNTLLVYPGSGCTWNSSFLTERDANNDLYIPPSDNYMAFIFDACRTTFTPKQVETMKSALANSNAISPVVISTNTCSAPSSRIVNNSTYIPVFYGTERVSVQQQIEGYLTYEWSVIGDSLINGKEYLKLRGHESNKEIQGLIPYWLDVNDTIDYHIREDTLKGQSWVYDSFRGEERLLYDFSLQEGDFYPGSDDVILYKIDTVITPKGERRRYRFHHPENTSTEYFWIEGIGNPLPHDPTIIYSSEINSNGELSGSYELLCMSRNGQLVYDEGARRAGINAPCSELVTVSTPSIKVLDPHIQLFPNPVNNFLTLLSEKLVHEHLSIRIFDNTGRIWLREVKQPGILKLDLNVSNLPQGIYLIQIQNKSGVQVERFIKQMF